MPKNRNDGIPPIIWAITLVILTIVCLLVFVIIRLAITMNDSRTFLEGTTVNSVDVSGLTAMEAEAKLRKKVEDYQLEVELAKDSCSISGGEIDLEVSRHNGLKKLIRTQSQDHSEPVSDTELSLTDEKLFTFNSTKLSKLVESWPELTELEDVKPKNARLVYSEDMGKFKVEPETIGGTVDAQALSNVIEENLLTLPKVLNAADQGLYGGIRTKDSSEMQNALSDANEKLKLKLTYVYSVPSAEINGTEEISYDLLSQWLFVEDDGITVGVNSDKLQNYVMQMYDTYSVHGNSSSRFVTSGGGFVDVDVPASDETVDTDALFNDIVMCVDTMTSGERKAPYASTSAGISGTTDLGGSYVEVDLDNQHLWVYKDHQLMAEGDICSGDVPTGCSTPDGLYTIKSMETDRWLNGADYHDWVSYWMPFNGGIGIHDATWRSADEFGGEVYLTAGSHGCINTPLELAKQIFENVEEGTYVILYGGVASTVDRVQTIVGTSKYSKHVGDGAFQLDAESTGGGSLTFASSNTKVATVDSFGKVTIVGAGSATIKVTAEATDTYMKASKNITITVKKREEKKEKNKSKKSEDKSKDKSSKEKDKNNDKDKDESKKDGDQSTDTKKPEEEKKSDAGSSEKEQEGKQDSSEDKKDKEKSDDGKKEEEKHEEEKKEDSKPSGDSGSDGSN